VTEPDLDRWLDDPVIRTRHRRTATAPPDALWDAAETVRLGDARTLGRIVGWRVPGVSQDTTFREMFRHPPFVVLAEGDGWSVSGLVGRIWTLDRDYPALDGPEAFSAFAEEHTAKVVFGHWVEPAENGSAIISEGRVGGTDDHAVRRLQALWAVVAPFERLIGGEALTLAALRADAAG
jgi:hypothetical protein